MSGLFSEIFSFWVFQAVAMTLTAWIIPKLKVTSIFGPILAVIGLSLVNATLWDAALFFQVPDSLGVQTLLLLGCNGTVFWLLVKLLPGIEVEGLIPAIVAPIVFTAISLLLNEYGREVNWSALFSYLFEVISGIKGQLKEGG